MYNRNLQLQTITIHQLLKERPCNPIECREFLLQFLSGRPSGTNLEHEEIRITSQLVRRARIAGVLRPYWFAARVLPDAVYHERFGTKLYHAVVQAGEAALSYCRDGYEGAEAVVDIDKVNYIDWELFYEAAVRTLIALIEEGERENYAKQQ